MDGYDEALTISARRTGSQLVLASLAALLISVSAGAGANDPARRGAETIVVAPGGSIQRAIDAVADGGKVMIAAGVYQESLIVSGKRVDLVGEGARGDHRTEIVQPNPREGVEPDRVHAVIRYEAGGGGSVEGVLIRGGDAGIASSDREGDSGEIAVSDSAIIGSGRGILWISNSDLAVAQTEVRETLGNGIAVATSGGKLDFRGVLMNAIGQVGLYISASGGPPTPPNCDVSTLFAIRIDDVFVGSAGGGGIFVVGGDRPVCISGGLLVANHFFGIELMSTQHVEIDGTTILDTAPRLFDGSYGDGVLARLSDSVQLHGLDIERSARSAFTLEGSAGTLEASLFNCNTLDLAGSDVEAGHFGSGMPAQDRAYAFKLLDGNVCGCGDQEKACQFMDWPAPPDPVDPTP